MTGPELRSIRDALGLSQEAFGRALGYEGSRAGVINQISDMEHGSRTITRMVERLAEMYGRHGVPAVYQGNGETRCERASTSRGGSNPTLHLPSPTPPIPSGPPPRTPRRRPQ